MNRQEIRRNTENVNYNSDRTRYTGEEYRANVQREQERVVNAQTARKIQIQRNVNPRDLLGGDPRIQETRRPTVLDRQSGGRTIRIDEDYKNYESKLPFQKVEKKYKGRI